VALIRNGKTADSLHCPEWITSKPYRTDRLTYSFSNQSKNTLLQLFGDSSLPRSTEYNAKVPGNHIRYYRQTQ